MVVLLYIQECIDCMRAGTIISLKRTYRFSYIKENNEPYKGLEGSSHFTGEDQKTRGWGETWKWLRVTSRLQFRVYGR